ncbi:MAG: TolB-like protein/Flp pilus assembly protein TadD [Lysobacterales bacterium]|jgi:TolB-like protein/Flp pilus assembly protein TadD
MTLFQELKRRNVFRVAIGYTIVAWLLLQVVDLVLENISSPDWVMQVFMLALAIGFPLAVFFAWAFEMTPDGIKREHEVDRTESITPQTGRKLDFTIIGILVLALGYFVFDKYSSDTSQPIAETNAEATVPASEAVDTRKSIAVLPFANRSSREEDEFFSDGIHDDLLTSLAKVGSLKVISRTSVMRYRGSELSIPEIAKELGVSTILEGGIQRSANQVRINVQLIDAQTDEHLWAENYDRELSAENLFAIQSEISHEIVTALKATLSDEESERLDAIPTTSLEAYGEFVLGRQKNALRTTDALEEAQEHFEKAIALDPNYVLAYVGLADSLALQATYGNLPWLESYAPRQAAIDRALELDPDSGEAYTSLGSLENDRFDYEKSEAAFKKAIELSPNYATAWHWYAYMLDQMERYEEALPLIRKAVELDPKAPIIATQLAGVYNGLGRVEEAIAVTKESLKDNPNFPNFYGIMVGMMERQGQLSEAARWAHANANLDSTNSYAAIRECTLYVQLGDENTAERCFDSAEEAYPQSAIYGQRALLHQYRGELADSLLLTKESARHFPDPNYQIGLGINYLNNGDWESAMAIVQQRWPELLGEEEVQIGPANDFRVFMAAWTLFEAGQKERANYLFDQVLAWMRTTHRTRGAGYGSGDVRIHVIRGEKQKAIAALHDAINTGWRQNWFRLRYPIYDVMLDEPEWIDLMTELEADIAKQRQWFEDHKDDPLF